MVFPSGGGDDLYPPLSPLYSEFENLADTLESVAENERTMVLPDRIPDPYMPQGLSIHQNNPVPISVDRAVSPWSSPSIATPRPHRTPRNTTPPPRSHNPSNPSPNTPSWRIATPSQQRPPRTTTPTPRPHNPSTPSPITLSRGTAPPSQHRTPQYSAPTTSSPYHNTSSPSTTTTQPTTSRARAVRNQTLITRPAERTARNDLAALIPPVFRHQSGRGAGNTNTAVSRGAADYIRSLEARVAELEGELAEWEGEGEGEDGELGDDDGEGEGAGYHF